MTQQVRPTKETIMWKFVAGALTALAVAASGDFIYADDPVDKIISTNEALCVANCMLAADVFEGQPADMESCSVERVYGEDGVQTGFRATVFPRKTASPASFPLNRKPVGRVP
jgi:hypothetical protein